MNRISSFLTILISLACVSCARGRIYKPHTPETLDATRKEVKYDVTGYKTDREKYEAALKTPDLDEAKYLRDRMINRIREMIEYHYREYELQLAADRALFETASDVVELGLSSATTVVGGEALKSILGAALTGAKGTRLSYTKNYLREKTTEIIITSMRATRQERLNLILEKMRRLNVKDYTFEEAKVDLADFFYAGTLQGALQSLAAQSGEREATAEREEKEDTESFIKSIAPATPQQATTIRDVRARLNEIRGRNDVAAAREILGRMETVDPRATGDQVFARLEELMQGSIDDASLRPRLFKAFFPDREVPQ